MGYPSEHELQVALVDHHRATLEADGSLLVAVPNGGGRNRAVAGQLRAEGVRAGVADLIRLCPGGRVRFLETKQPGGGLSEDQLEFRDHVVELGHPCDVIRSLAEMDEICRVPLPRANGLLLEGFEVVEPPVQVKPPRRLAGMPKLPRTGTKRAEHLLQVALVRFHHLTRGLADRGCLLFAVANGGLRSKPEAIRMVAEGVWPGVSDLVLVLPAGRIVWIELKNEAAQLWGIDAGVLSKEQRAFQTRCAALGHDFVVIRSVEDFAALLTHLGLRRPGFVLSARPAVLGRRRA